MKPKSLSLLLLVLGFLPALKASADEPLVDDAFERTELGEGWSVNKGEWKIVDGVLRAREVPTDKHAAAARRALFTQDAVYSLRFRFVGEGKALHFGFDPAKGESPKIGHLFSLIVTPTDWKIMKHPDKAKPKEDPGAVLAQAKTTFKTGEWYSLRVTTAGDQVIAEIEGKEMLKASHPTFHIKKPTLVFRCVGDGVEIDDLRVRTARK